MEEKNDNNSGGPTFSFDATAVGAIDGLGRLRSANETISKTSGTVSHSYTYNYDMRSQLTNATITNINSGTWTAVYNYRKDGNLDTRQETGMSQPAAFEYDFDDNGSDDGDIMTSASGGETFTLTWDDNGNMKKLPNDSVSTQLTYNWDNKLRSAANGSNPISLKYDPDGNRIWKQSTVSGQTTTRKYVVDVAGDLPTILLEIEPSNGNIMKTYIYANGEILAQHDGNESAPRYFYFLDRLGSVRQVINKQGQVINFYMYQLIRKS